MDVNKTTRLGGLDFGVVKVFAGDEKLTTALLDRLAHHATVIATKGKSYRMRKRTTDEKPPQTTAEWISFRAAAAREFEIGGEWPTGRNRGVVFGALVWVRTGRESAVGGRLGRNPAEFTAETARRSAEAPTRQC